MNRVIISTILLFLPFYPAEDQPQFKGGSNALAYFLSQSLIYPEYSKQNCISATIQVSFNLDQNGNLSHVKVYKGLGIDLDDEAIRVVKLTTGKWIVPVGYSPNQDIILPIKFNMQNSRCLNKYGCAKQGYCY